MLLDKNLFGTIDKIARGVDRLQYFVPPEGYWLAFSGGKDSQAIYHLAKEAGVKFDAHFSLTTVDPPELIYFIRENYPDVIIDKPELTMWQLIEKKLIPPTRIARYCCEYLKEHGGEGRVCVTGVRWAESNKRKKNRAGIELSKTKSGKRMLLNDNDEARRIIETCQLKGRQIINPIIDWLESDVWDYLNGRDIKHCKLYDEGFKRIGCIGCPMAGAKGMVEEFKRWPKYREAYLRAFKKMLAAREAKGINNGPTHWHTPEDVMTWWIYGRAKTTDIEQLIIDSFNDDEF